MDRVARAAPLALLGNHDEAAIGRGRGGMNAVAEAAVGLDARPPAPPKRPPSSAALPLESRGGGPALRPRRRLRPRPLALRARSRGRAPQPGSDAGAGDLLRPHPRPAPLRHHRRRQAGQLHARCAGVPVPLLRPRQWLAVLGAVGQPRDGDPAACYGMLDTARARADLGPRALRRGRRRRRRSAPPACRSPWRSRLPRGR